MKKRISALVLSSCLLAGCAGQGAAATGETAAPSQAVPTAAPQSLTVNGLLDTSAAVGALELYAQAQNVTLQNSFETETADLVILDAPPQDDGTWKNLAENELLAAAAQRAGLDTESTVTALPVGQSLYAYWADNRVLTELLQSDAALDDLRAATWEEWFDFVTAVTHWCAEPGAVQVTLNGNVYTLPAERRETLANLNGVFAAQGPEVSGNSGDGGVAENTPALYTTALLAAGFYREGRVPAGPPRLLVDIGTNGEMALAADGRLLCCSTAAGPALEGAGIHQGVMARTGAIYRVRLEGLTMVCDVLGGGEAQGICGSGLVDAVAALCEAGVIQDTGLIDEESHAFTAYVEECDGQPAFRLPGTAVRLTQKDIRAVQLAKSAICAGMRTLIAEAGLQAEAIAELVVAGGFGSRIDPVSAERIGLFPAGFAAKARAVGNAAGAGAAMVLLSDPIRREAEGMPAAVRTVELSSHPGFMDAYIDGMYFA